MRVCLISVEIFAWGKYGGFGRATRLIGRELARRGVEVTAVIPRRQDQKPVEYLDGIRVLGFKPRELPSVPDLFYGNYFTVIYEKPTAKCRSWQ